MITDSQPPHNINSTIAHLARDLRWTKEKPYIVDFAVPKGAALSNHIIQKYPVTILDLRDSIFRPTLAENGFCLVTIQSNMTAAEALENPRQCEEMYFGEIRAAMYAHFPEYRRFECYDLTVWPFITHMTGTDQFVSLTNT